MTWKISLWNDHRIEKRADAHAGELEGCIRRCVSERNRPQGGS